MTLTLTPLHGIPLLRQGDDLADILMDGLQKANIELADGDILVITSKIVSKAEGRMVDLATVTPSERARELARQADKDPRVVELLLQESAEILRVRVGTIIVEHRLGFVCANAGIDHSNVAPLQLPPNSSNLGGENAMPNNWLSCFGGSAWEYDERTGEYYLHTFAKQQPDLNFRNPEVVAAMLDAMRFWLDKGVDGFRVDVITGMIKDEALRDEPANPNWDGVDPYASLLHIYSSNLPEVHEVIRKMRELIDSYDDRVLIGEIYALPNPELVKYYGANLDECHLPFNFSLIWIPWKLELVKEKIEAYEAALPPGAYPNWVLGNHDQPRIATRAGREQARVATMLLLTLRGTPTYYQGDEIGMENVPIPLDMLQDPPAVNQPELAELLGRDPERTPMQWDDSPNAGFTSPDARPWLPLADNYKEKNVARQLNDPHSFLNFFRTLVAYRKASPALSVGTYRAVQLESAEARESCLVYERESGNDRLLVALNFTRQEQKVDLPFSGTGRIILSTTMDREGNVDLATFTLKPDEGCIIDLSGN